MALFKFIGKKQETCSCGGNCAADKTDTQNVRFVVLGNCCKKAVQTFENTQKALAQLGLPDIAVNIGDPAQIAAYGVMQTPALVIDGKVVSYGKLLTVEEICTLITKEQL